MNVCELSLKRQKKGVSGKFFPIKDLCELVSGKLSKYLYIHSYTHLIPSFALNECLLVQNFQYSCSTECH